MKIEVNRMEVLSRIENEPWLYDKDIKVREL